MTLILCLLVSAAPVKPGDAIVLELGMPEVAGLSELVGVKYQSDAAGPEEVRKTPEKYPLRVAVLNAADAVRESYKLKIISEVFEAKAEFAKKDISNFQEDLASSILRLREAYEELTKATERRKNESSPRWLAHLDFLLAETKFRAGTLEELNLAYGKVHRSELPKVEAPKTGWKLDAVEKMQSKPDIRRMVEEAREDFEAIAKAHAGTPWAKLAERELAQKAGLGWIAAEVKPPAPPKMEKKKKP